jgi:hypothetical protein
MKITTNIDEIPRKGGENINYIVNVVQVKVSGDILKI